MSKNNKIKMYLYYLLFSLCLCYCDEINFVPILSLTNGSIGKNSNRTTRDNTRNLPFIMLPDRGKDTNEYWRDTEIISLVKHHYENDACNRNRTFVSLVRFPSRRSVRPICRTKNEYQLCPQCPYFSNITECELFRDSCHERKVHPSEYLYYCENKYGKWRTMFIPADYSNCQCCDECVFYRELDQSCMHDEYDFNNEEFLPTTTIDFRAGCNPYKGHPDEKLLALRCDKVLRRCVPNAVRVIPEDIVSPRRNYRYQPLKGDRDCPPSCRGYECPPGLLQEAKCSSGAFIPNSDYCNCCGRCSTFYQFNEKCAEYTRTHHIVNGSTEIEVEEEFLEPGCDDGLVCRQGRCQDIHTVESSYRRKRSDDDDSNESAKEPCKQELKYFKKKYGEDGHLHFDAPQCTPLWLYAPVQCRRFLCYCAMEDGTMIEGIKVPRIEVSNMNCDCAREKCRYNPDLQCDGLGNYRNTIFTPHHEDWIELDTTTSKTQNLVKHVKPTKTTARDVRSPTRVL